MSGPSKIDALGPKVLISRKYIMLMGHKLWPIGYEVINIYQVYLDLLLHNC